jgi:UDP-glucose 4-epimerase
MNWKNKNAVVTGACGFIGSHLVEALVRNGAKVRALVYYNARGSNGWLDELAADVKETVEIMAGDVRDTEQMSRLIKEGDHVFHLAALIGIPYSYHAPRSYFDVNAIGTMNILEAVREKGAASLVITSTSEVYGTARFVPITEEHPLQAQSPYSASKIAAEKLAESYFASFNLPVIIARPFNTFGPRQSPRAVIATILMQLAKGAREIHIGDIRPTRDFNYVKDTVEALMRLSLSGKSACGKPVNIGTGKEISIGELVKLAMEIVGRKAKIAVDKKRLRPEKSEVMRLCADSSRLKKLTGFVPPSRLKEGLEKTFNWMCEKERPDYDAKKYYI